MNLSNALTASLRAFRNPNAVQPSLNSIPALLTPVRTATKKAGGGRTNNKDSAGQRLGIKASDGERVNAGQILYRQRGTIFYPGEHTAIGRDHTIYAKEPGYVKYYYDPFHPKRRLVGITFDRQASLPTPHFAPRARRFGHDLITLPVEAAKELQSMSRKEYLAQDEIAEFQQRLVANQTKRRSLLESRLVELGISGEHLPLAVRRFDDIRNYLTSGRSSQDAYNLTLRGMREEIQLSVRLNKLSPEAAEAQLSELATLSQQWDSMIMFDARAELQPFLTTAELEAMRSKLIKQLEDITKDVSVKTRGIKNQINRILTAPCFSKKDQTHLARFYSRTIYKDIVADESKPELSKKSLYQAAKDGKGSIVKKFNYETESVDVILRQYL